MEESFNSEFCTVAYQPADNVVLLTWKKFARLQDYRIPALFAQELLQRHLYSEFVVDARSGFEDDKEDVAWGFDVLLPAMAETSCSAVAFILNEVSTIEAEMDLWTAEFAKYFAVLRATSYRQAIELLGHRLQSQVFYTVKPGTRDAFLAELKRRGLPKPPAARWAATSITGICRPTQRTKFIYKSFGRIPPHRQPTGKHRSMRRCSN